MSRYEEYLPFKPDQHHRFPATESLAFKAGFLEQPIIHEWLNLLINTIKKTFPNFSATPKHYAFSPTYDIDIPWAFRHRGPRGWARAGLDLINGNWPLVKARYSSIKNKAKDPFYCFQSSRRNMKNLVFVQKYSG